MSFNSLNYLGGDVVKRKNFLYDEFSSNEEGGEFIPQEYDEKDLYEFDIKQQIEAAQCKRKRESIEVETKNDRSATSINLLKKDRSFMYDDQELKNKEKSASKNESQIKLEGMINENDYLIQLNKLKRHVVIEIFGGKCFIKEYLCMEFLKRIKKCCQINCIKYNIGLINYRDCKQLLGENNNIASIEVRLNSILVSLPPVTCVILHLSIFLVIKEDLIRDDLIKKLCAVTKRYTLLYKNSLSLIQNNRPFEFCALECVFSCAVEHLKAEVQLLEKDFNEIKFSVKIHKYQEILSQLHNLKEPTNLLLDKVNSFIKAFHEISVNRSDLKKMELTKFYFSPNFQEDDNKDQEKESDKNKGKDRENKEKEKDQTNQDLEMLLEYFDQELHQIRDQVKHLYESTINLENRIYLDLSLSRNNLIRMDIVIGLINSGFGIGTLITGVFGMNLKIYLEEHSFAFFVVTGIVTSLCLLTVFLSIYFFKCIRL